MGLKTLTYSIAIGFALLANAPAFAHKVVISAFAEGDIIEGEVGFSNGDMALNTAIEILDQEGNVIGNTTTDDEGIFQYRPTRAIPLTFRANLGQGHVAIYNMPVEELPEISGDDAPRTENAVSDMSKAGAVSGSFANIDKQVAVDSDQLSKQVREAVKQEMAKAKSEIASAIRKDIKPLRKEISSYKEKNDFQTILGGIGYIVGLFGFGFYIAARRERRAAEQLKSPKAAS